MHCSMENNGSIENREQGNKDKICLDLWRTKESEIHALPHNYTVICEVHILHFQTQCTHTLPKSKVDSVIVATNVSRRLCASQ